MCSPAKSDTHPTYTFARFGTVTGFVGAHATLWLTVPHLCAAIAFAEIALTITIGLTALYAPPEFSERAFRLLPWARPHCHMCAPTKPSAHKADPPRIASQ
jgi:hypothetical protein